VERAQDQRAAAAVSRPATKRTPSALEREDLLPVIVFIFSRAACDDAAHQCRRDGLMFTTPEERRDIEAIAQSRLTTSPMTT
jgi:superfamily II RNA helicase